MSEQQEEKLNTCKWWLDRGFALLPVQPNKKFLVAGYGEHKKKITTYAEAQEMIEKFSSANIAVLGGKAKIILDFDIPVVYDDWKARHLEIATTYTERTPRGGAHVFAYGGEPFGMIWKEGVEFKKICIVSPSVVDDKPYTRGAGEIIAVNTDIFSSLSKIGTRSAYVLEIERKRGNKKPYRSYNLVEQIKANNDIRHVFDVYHPEQKIGLNSLYQTVRCVFHDDHKASMCLDADHQTYRCFACNAHGDVINLYAHFEHITVREAISRMARALQAVR
jgi:hypothetical protein